MFILLKQYIVDIKILFMFSIKAQYGRSMLGSLWVIVKPFINTLTFAVIMSKIANLSPREFFGFIAINLATWGFISNVLSTAPYNFIYKKNLLMNKQFSLNKLTLVYITKATYIYLISLILPLTTGFLIGSLKLGLELIIVLLYIVILIYILFCISFIISVIFSYFEDIGYLIEIGLPIGMWLTPVVYPIEKIPGILGQLQHINPFYILISPFTTIFYKHTLPSITENLSLLILAIICSLVYYISCNRFSKNIIYRLG